MNCRWKGSMQTPIHCQKIDISPQDLLVLVIRYTIDGMLDMYLVYDKSGAHVPTRLSISFLPYCFDKDSIGIEQIRIKCFEIEYSEWKSV
jgi:hypothetical protein